MERDIILTEDGSHSIELAGSHQTYHSRFGAIQESMHVFIRPGLLKLSESGLKRIRVFEMGFGTGLNTLLTLIEAEKLGLDIYYETVEQFPLSLEMAARLNYCGQLKRMDLQDKFLLMHEWEAAAISPHFFLRKLLIDFNDYAFEDNFHLIYYDAFGPASQPALWTPGIFEKIERHLYLGGILMTYSAKGDVRRAMSGAGFKVEKLMGPPGKREITCAIKTENRDKESG
jgi:tRNA U34 5-methylaminomethyl-2-thiouridine-forming methyltransferase MnmC